MMPCKDIHHKKKYVDWLWSDLHSLPLAKNNHHNLISRYTLWFVLAQLDQKAMNFN